MIQAVDAHACGEHGRVIVGGVLDVPGRTMYDKMCHLRAHADGLRLWMLREPRGYPAASCNLILPPTDPAADAGFIIMEQVEYPGMSGTNAMCVTTVLLETGVLPMHEPMTELTLETPAGLIRVRADCAGGMVHRVTFRKRARVRRVPRSDDRRAAARQRRGRRRLGRHVLRDRRCGASRLRLTPDEAGTSSALEK